MVIAKEEEKPRIIKFLDELRLSCIVATDRELEAMRYFDSVNSKKPTYIVDPAGVKELLKKENYYYISGVVAILYPDEEKEVFDTYKIVTQYLCHKEGIHIVHILSKNVFFPSLGKNITDLIEGRIVSVDSLCL